MILFQQRNAYPRASLSQHNLNAIFDGIKNLFNRANPSQPGVHSIKILKIYHIDSHPGR